MCRQTSRIFCRHFYDPSDRLMGWIQELEHSPAAATIGDVYCQIQTNILIADKQQRNFRFLVASLVTTIIEAP